MLPRRAPGGTGSTFNMADALLDRHVTDGRGDRPAIRTTDGLTLTYGELQRHANRAGNLLRDAGVEPEQRVAILLHDGPEFIAVFLGAMKIGAVPVPLNTTAPTEDLRYFVEHSRARAVVAEADIVSRLAPLWSAGALADVKVVFSVVAVSLKKKGTDPGGERLDSPPVGGLP